MLIAQPNSANVTVSSDVTLTCKPLRGTPVEYSWHRVDGDIPLHSSGQNSSRLTIHRIVPADEGEYYCMGTLLGHCAKSNTVEVMVNGKKGYHVFKYPICLVTNVRILVHVTIKRHLASYHSCKIRKHPYNV